MHYRKFKITALGIVLFPLFSAGQQVFTTNVIIQGSMCVGVDCVTNESFGFDTGKYKENNLRIYFDDTSNSASFPNNDWRLAINDSNNGGASYFAVQDATANTTPLRVMAGAGNNALYVRSGGNVGLGTDFPVVELHVTDGDSPTLRLEQNGTAGFAPQTWDVAGNETNFFIRDVTGGSKLPFKIRPGAPDNSIYVNPSGHVTLGGSTDKEQLFVKGNISAEGDMHLGRTGVEYYKLALIEGGTTFSIQDAVSGNNVVVIQEDAPTSSLHIHDDGDISIGTNVKNRKLYVNGGLTVNGDIFALSDRRIKQNISDVKYGLSDVLKLSGKQFNFNTEGYEELNLSKDLQLGLIAQDVQNIVPEVVTNDINVKDRDGKMTTLKGVNYTALIPVLIHAIQQQQELIIEKDTELESIKSQLDQLTARVDALTGQNVQSNELPVAGSAIGNDSDNPNATTVPIQAKQAEEALDNGRSEADKLKLKKAGDQ